MSTQICKVADIVKPQGEGNTHFMIEDIEHYCKDIYIIRMRCIETNKVRVTTAPFGCYLRGYDIL